MHTTDFLELFESEMLAEKPQIHTDPIYRSVAAELGLMTHPDWKPGQYRIREEQGGYTVDTMRRDGKWIKSFWCKQRSQALKTIAQAHAS